MKKMILFCLGLFAAAMLPAQSPDMFQYQAVVRDATGAIKANQSVKFRISILEGSLTGTLVLQETHPVSTNEFGLVNLEIGNGYPVSGNITSINWGSNTYYLKVELDPTGGTNFIHLGTSQLLSVPYALHAKTVQIDQVNDADHDPANEIQELQLTGTQLTLSKDGGTVTLPSTGGGPFASAGGITSNSPITDNFVFGSASMDNLAGPDDDYRMFFNKMKGAFRAGYASDDRWNQSKVGDCSFAVGYNTTASANFSTAMGDITYATGYASTAMGFITTASGAISTAMGSETTASGIYSTAIGERTTASGYCTTALGRYNVGGGNAVAWLNTDPLFEIGNGTFQVVHNALTVLKNGYVGFGTANPAAGLHLKADTWPGSFIYLEANDGQDAGMRLYEGSTEKWHIYNSSGGGGLRIANNANQIAVFAQQSNSFVGIATTTPAYQLQVGNAGDGTEARANAWNLLSDARLKKDFEQLVNPLDIVERINGYYFYWNTGTDYTRQVGFSAQEVRKVLPEVVSEGEDGYLSIEYGKMAPLLVEAIKELKAENDRLKERLEKVEQLLSSEARR